MMWMSKYFFPEPVSPGVRAEQIRLLYHQGVPIQTLGIFTAIVSVTMFWNVAGHAMLSLWLGIHIVVSLIRLAATVKFTRSPIVDHRTLERWGVPMLPVRSYPV